MLSTLLERFTSDFFVDLMHRLAPGSDRHEARRFFDSLKGQDSTVALSLQQASL